MGKVEKKIEHEGETIAVIDTQATPIEKTSVVASVSAGVMILQWLTYAFWGWTLIVFSILTYAVLASTFTGLNTSDWAPYVVAAALVLLPISLVCDYFYGRHEKVKKSGGSVIIMVIHAVIFALFGIGALISAVFVVVQMSIDPSADDSKDQFVLAATLLLSATFYALTFFRTLNPTDKIRVRVVYPIVMGVSIGLFVVAGFVGPIGQARLATLDQKASDAVDSISESINSYVEDKGSMPTSLAALSLSSSVDSAVAASSITYETAGYKNKTIRNYRDETAKVEKIFQYKICVNYNVKSGYDGYARDNKEEYSSYVSTSNHPAGMHCYKLSTNRQSDMR